jgi:hypothetical protein
MASVDPTDARHVSALLKSHLFDAGGGAGLGSVMAESWPLAQRRQVPDFHGLTPAPRDQELAVGAEGDGGDDPRVTAEAVD